jgi:hypothetical protein
MHEDILIRRLTEIRGFLNEMPFTVRDRVLNDVVHYVEGIQESKVSICVGGLQVLDHDMQG